MQPEPTTAPPTRRPLLRRLAVAAGVLALVGGVAAAGWTWRHPHAFDETGGGTVGMVDVPVGQAAYFGMTFDEPDASGTVAIDSAAAHIDGSAEASVDYLVCTADPAGEPGMIGSASESDISEFCPTLEPLEGATYEFNATPRQQLVLAITPSGPGRVRVDDVELSYRDGWQRGTQHLGEVFEVRTGRG